MWLKWYSTCRANTRPEFKLHYCKKMEIEQKLMSIRYWIRLFTHVYLSRHDIMTTNNFDWNYDRYLLQKKIHMYWWTTSQFFAIIMAYDI
jgi:hypothetical protein